MINELIKSKYSETTFYCHNLGGYDIVFILNVLCKYNDSLSKDNDKETKYRISCIFRDDKIIKS